MPYQNLWNSDILKRAGHQLNTDLLRAFHEYCSSGKNPVPVTLGSAAAFAGLVLANMNIDPKKRDLFLGILQDPILDPQAYKKLRILKWTPVQRMLLMYARPHVNDVAPTLPRLIELQKERHKNHPPCWSSLMPDKLYAMSAFKDYPLEMLDPLLLPFGKPTQEAFALYTGTVIKGQPKMVHHEQLRKMCVSWAHISGTPNASAIEINSGLHCFGEGLS